MLQVLGQTGAGAGCDGSVIMHGCSVALFTNVHADSFWLKTHCIKQSARLCTWSNGIVIPIRGIYSTLVDFPNYRLSAVFAGSLVRLHIPSAISA